MKKSKLTALLLAAVMSVGMFTACGKGDESASDAADAKTIRDLGGQVRRGSRLHYQG